MAERPTEASPARPDKQRPDHKRRKMTQPITPATNRTHDIGDPDKSRKAPKLAKNHINNQKAPPSHRKTSGQDQQGQTK